MNERWKLAEVLQTLERFLLPNHCVCCERKTEGERVDSLMCRVCESRMQPVVGSCPRCRQPSENHMQCRFCVTWPSNLQVVRSAVWLGAEARSLIHSLKYRGLTKLGAVAARIIAARVAPPGDAIVPVPLSRRRQRARGYNQVDYIAYPLADLWRMPVLETALVKSRETRSQTELTPRDRLANVSGAFSAGITRQNIVGLLGKHHPRLVLVDDVLTTGATLGAAAAALTEVSDGVAAVSFARARTFGQRIEEEIVSSTDLSLGV